MHGIPSGDPSSGAPDHPNDPHRPRTGQPAASPMSQHQHPATHRRRFSRVGLVAAGVATIVLLLVAAGFVRLTDLVGAVRAVSTPSALVSPAVGGASGAGGIALAQERAESPPPARGGAAGAADLPEAWFAAPADGNGPAETTGRTPPREERRQASPPAARGAAPDGSGPGWLDNFAGDAGQTLAGIASVAGVGEAPLPPLTILLMGVDARTGEAIDIGVRPDAMVLLRLDPETGACRMLAIPRDTRAELPGYGLSKVNHALAVGGVPFQRQVVERLLRLGVDRFVLVDLRALEEVVAIVDGVTLDVPEAFVAADGTPIEAGEQILDGREVLAYVQYRGGPDGDLGRIGRQQQVLRALLAKASDLEVLATISRLLPVLEDHLRTDLTPAEIVGLAQRFRGSCTPDTLSVAMLDGSIATFVDPLVQQPLSYLVIDAAEIVREREILLTGTSG